MYYDAYSLIWMSILFVCVLFGIRSGFIPLHWVLFPAIGNIVRHSFFSKWRGEDTCNIYESSFFYMLTPITFRVNYFKSILITLTECTFIDFVDWKWLCYQLGSLSLSYIQSFYLTLGALYLFIPIMGRSGGSINSEVVIANMISILFCQLLCFTVKY